MIDHSKLRFSRNFFTEISPVPDELKWLTPPPQNYNYNLSCHFENDLIGAAVLELNGTDSQVRISIKSLYQDNQLILISLLQIAKIYSEELSLNSRQFKIESFFPDLEKLGRQIFGRSSENSGYPKEALKKQIRSVLPQKTKLGRGYIVDVNEFDVSAVKDLAREYHDVAWGLTNWAKHSAVANDELHVIEKYVSGNSSGLEVGAGSGRVTAYLAEKTEQLTATDLIPEFESHLKKIKATNLKCIYDDIVNTELPHNSFDVVMFWENGLGALLDSNSRQQAVKNLFNLTKPSGRVIIGVRRLRQDSADHLMIAAQTDLVMGIYHTFGDTEISGLIPKNAELMECYEGEERPAGGRQYFYVYQKNEVNG